MKLRFETWDAGAGYTGHDAAADELFVAKIEKALRENWPDPYSNYIEFH